MGCGRFQGIFGVFVLSIRRIFAIGAICGLCVLGIFVEGSVIGSILGISSRGAIIMIPAIQLDPPQTVLYPQMSQNSSQLSSKSSPIFPYPRSKHLSLSPCPFP